MYATEETWMEAAACRTLPSADVMFPNLDRQDEVDKAKRVCGKCPVATQRECAIFAIQTDDKFSISGGMTPKERKRWANAEAA